MTIEDIKKSKYLVIESNTLVKSRLIVVVDSLNCIKEERKFVKEAYELVCHTALYDFNFKLILTHADDIYIECTGINSLFRVKIASNTIPPLLQIKDTITYVIDNETIVVKIDDYKEEYGLFLCKVSTDTGRFKLTTIQKKYANAKIKGFTTTDEREIAPSLVLCSKLAKGVEQ